MHQYRGKGMKKRIILKKWTAMTCFGILMMGAVALTAQMPATVQAETTSSTGSSSSTSTNYINTTLNTFIHDAETSQVGVAGQDMELHLRIGYDGINGFYNPASPSISNVHVRLTNDKNFVSSDEDAAAAKNPKKNPYDENDDDEAEAYNAYNEGYSAGITRSYNTNLGLTYPINGGKYPFEVNNSLTAQQSSLGTLKRGEYKDVSFSVTVRSDTEAGYYAVPITIWYDVPANASGSYGSLLKTEFINVYIQAAGDVANPSTMTKDTVFVAGENQQTPAGTYGSVMNFGVNFRNRSSKSVYDVLVHMNTTLGKDSEVQNTAKAKSSAATQFPFDINEANYDRHFDEVRQGETITPPYSMAIKGNAASGFYPLSFTVTYKQTPNGTVTASESYTFYVNISNPSMNETETETLGDFNENDRTKARLVVDSFHTVPDKVYAGQPFQLIFTMKNASDKIPASNILFTLDSEKVSDSPVLTTQGGANSIVLNSLAAGESKELSIGMTAEPGVDPRSYTVTINEKYDSPEFKNAAEKVDIPISINQVARLSVSNFSIEPPQIEVGNQSDVMFGINNTGKVTLYNVEALFAADSIEQTSSYVGNIKPGETGNVDVMLTGLQPTADDGTINVTIQYEDVNGEQFTQNETINMMVTEAQDLSEGMTQEADAPAERSPFEQYRKFIIGGGAVLAALIAAGIVRRIQKKKKEKQNTDETI